MFRVHARSTLPKTQLRTPLPRARASVSAAGRPDAAIYGRKTLLKGAQSDDD